MRIHFLSFKGEYFPSKFGRAKEALLQMVHDMGVFDTIQIVDEKELLNDPEFQKHIPFILQNRRGFGYWIWKAYLIHKKLCEIDEGDIVFYSDVCTSIRVEGKERFLEYIEHVKKHPQGNLFFSYSNIISDWCKMDTIKCLNAEDVMYQKEVVAGILFTTANQQNKDFFLACYNVVCHYHLVDDSPSIEPNVPSFKEHRHDQSIFSILSRKYMPQSISDVFTNDELNFYKREEEGKRFPIWTQTNHY